MQPTHRSHFTVQQSSKFSQPGALIFIPGLTVQQSQVCSRSYQSSAMVSNVLCECVSVSVQVSLCTCVHAYATGGGTRVEEKTERVRDPELQTYCWEHGCITQGGYGTECESAERQINSSSQTLQGLSVFWMYTTYMA